MNGWKKYKALFGFLFFGFFFIFAAYGYFKFKDWKPVDGKVTEIWSTEDVSFICLIGYRVDDDDKLPFYSYEGKRGCDKTSYVGETYTLLYDPKDHSDAILAGSLNINRNSTIVLGALCATCALIGFLQLSYYYFYSACFEGRCQRRAVEAIIT